MTYFDNGFARLYQADARHLPIPDSSVDCVVTSPPYWGLRDYGLEEQGIGLEQTPEEYCANMVEVFREVRRVLKPTGTVFLNLGDSYFGGGGAHKPSHANPGLSNSAQRDGVPHGGRNGTGGKGQSGSTDGAYASRSLCGECVIVLSYRNLDTYGCPAPKLDSLISESIRSRTEQPIDHSESLHSASQGDQSGDGLSGQPPSLDRAGEQPPASQESTPPLSSEQPLEDCRHCASCGACLDVISSAKPYALVCARTGGRLRRNGTYTLWSVPHKADKDASGLAYLDYTTASLKPKDLVGIPWRVAFALQADGWYLRSDIIWSKPNPMPESVTDRPTKAHEYVFLLTKSPGYYYDADAIREPAQDWGARDRSNNKTHSGLTGLAPHSGLTGAHDGEEGRNKRSVWEITTHPYPEAHFATYPEKLVEPCILAGTSEKGVCAECGQPWERVVEKVRSRNGATPNIAGREDSQAGNTAKKSLPSALRTDASRSGMGTPEIQTTGWQPTCDCNAEVVPATVLDPFAGSGTTLAVAQRLGRKSIGADLSEEYLRLASKRLGAIPMPMILA